MPLRTRTPVRLSLRRGRQLAVMGQLLSSPQPRSILEVVRGLGEVQVDPTNAVARTEHLVLWSRLGRRYRRADLERLLYRDRELFEHFAHIFPTSDYPLYREWMRGYPSGETSRHVYVRGWLAANDGFRRYVLRELRRRGPLRSRDLEDRTDSGWRTGGWNDDGRNVSMMLEILWRQGRVAIVGRDGNQRVWDLAARHLPLDPPRVSRADAARRIVEGQLRARGIAVPSEFGYAFGERLDGWDRALEELVREGAVVPAEIEGLSGEWYAYAEFLDRRFRPRTTLLSPFDDLISDRRRTEQLFGFRFRLEIYVPKAKREFGYFVLPILHGDRLVGRIDPAFDRSANVMRVNAVYPEPDAPADAWPVTRGAIDELGAWLGAEEVVMPTPPAPWH